MLGISMLGVLGVLAILKQVCWAWIEDLEEILL